MSDYYDRYKAFRVDGHFTKVPFITIKNESGDVYITFDKEKMRLDNLSYKYYGDPDYAWLLMTANPQYGSMEFDIPDKCTFRIPYPLTSALLRYERAVKG